MASITVTETERVIVTETEYLKKLVSLSMAAALVGGVMMSTAHDAEARWRGRGVGLGVAAGIVTLGVLGAAASARAGYSCYPGLRQCDWVGRSCYYNRFGDYVCSGGSYRCYRPTICP